MFIVMNRIAVSSEKRSEFEKSFSARDRAVALMPGFIDMQVLRPTEGNCYIVMTRWKAEEHFRGWTNSEAFRLAHKSSSPRLQEDKPVLEMYDEVC